MAQRFIQRLEGLGFSVNGSSTASSSSKAAGGLTTTLKASDLEWLFASSVDTNLHPAAAVIRAVSDKLDQCSYVSSEQKVAYESLKAQGKILQVRFARNVVITKS
jgi:hypothetical protein